MSNINAGVVIEAVTTTWFLAYLGFSDPTSNFGYVLTCCSFLNFVQTLGIDHAMASFIWLCGPITGFVVSHSRENNAIFLFWSQDI